MNKVLVGVSIARMDEPDFFKKTHTPMQFNRLRRMGDGLTFDKTINEDDLLKEILSKKTGNHSSIIFGEPGVGKSELCAYLYLKINDLFEGRAKIVYFNRNSRLQDLLKEIDKIYRKITGSSLPGNHSEVVNRIRAQPKNYANAFYLPIITSLQTITSTELSEEFEKNPDARNGFLNYITNKLPALFCQTSNEEASSPRNFLEPESLNLKPNDPWASILKKYLGGTDNSSSLKKVADCVNEAFDDALTNMVGIDVNSALIELSKKVNERIFIIFEDFNLSDVQCRKLANFLEATGIDEYKCEFIIAGVRSNLGYLDSRTGYARHSYYQLESEDKDSTFLSVNNAPDFLLSYLTYWKTYKIQCDCPLCNKVKEILGEKESTLFPLSSLFISNAYNGLRRNPRELIELVKGILLDYSEGIPPYKSDALAICQFPSKNGLNQDNELERLIAWYGKDTDNGIILDTIYRDAFGVVSTSMNVQNSIGKLLFVGNGSSPDGDDGGESPEEKIELVDRKGIEGWRIDPEKYPKITALIEVGANKAMKSISDDWRITKDWAYNNGPSILCDYQTDNPVSFINTGSGEIHFNQKDFTFDELVTLYQIGVKNKVTDRFKEKIPKPLVGALAKWKEKKWSDLSNIKTHKSENGQITLADLTAHMMSVYMEILYPFEQNGLDLILKKFNPEKSDDTGDLTTIIHKSSEFQLLNNIPRLTQNEVSEDLGKLFNIVIESSNEYEAVKLLFQAFYTFDGSLIDINKLGRSLEKSKDSTKLVSECWIKKSKETIPHEFKVNTSVKIPIQDIVSKYVNGVRTIEQIFLAAGIVDENIVAELTQFRDWLDEVNADTNKIKKISKQIQQTDNYQSIVRSLDDFIKECKRPSSPVNVVSYNLEHTLAEIGCSAWILSMRYRLLTNEPIYHKYAELRTELEKATSKSIDNAESDPFKKLRTVLRNVQQPQ